MTLKEIENRIKEANTQKPGEDFQAFADRRWAELPRIYYNDLPPKLKKEADKITISATKATIIECSPVGSLEKYLNSPALFDEKIKEALHSARYLVESTKVMKCPATGITYFSLLVADLMEAWGKVTEISISPLFLNYLQGEALNKFAIAQTKTAKPDLLGNAYVKVDESFMLKINNYSDLKGGAIPPAALQVLDSFIITFTQAPNKSAKIRLPLKKFMEWRGISDPKTARSQVLEGIKTLKNMEYTAKERIKGEWVDSGWVSIYGGTGYIKNGIIYFNFNADFYENLMRYTPMAYLTDKLKINTKQFPHAYYFSRWIDLNYRMNEGKDRVNTISVKTLLSKAPNLPTYKEVAATTRQYYKLIIAPFVKNLDAIEHLYFDFIDENGEIIEDPLTAFKGSGGYTLFEASKIKIDYGEYPKHSKRLEKKQKHAEEHRKALVKAKAAEMAKSAKKEG